MKHGNQSSTNGQNSRPLWPTARAEDSESCGNHPNATDSLTGAIKNWTTPNEADSRASGNRNLPGSKAHIGESLTDQTTRNWKTPHGFANTDKDGKTGGGGGGEFQKQVRLLTGKKKLNPNFVDWLMGFPPGWSSVLIDFGLVEMQLYRSRLLGRLSALVERLDWYGSQRSTGGW